MTQEEFHKRYQYNPGTDCLGEGGFGKVYKAYDTHRDRYVAIKMAEVKPHLEEVRLKKEVEMISKLPTHPNIAYYEECYSFATFAGEYDFGILQYYEEGNLQQLVNSAQLTNEQKDIILRQILDGIAFLHQQGIIHRDLKPQNILIVNRNGEFIPKITDFGISKQLDASHSSVYTNSLSGAGTLAFASPEQLCGQEIRKNTDIWSFGVIASWLFSSKLPFSTSTEVPTNEGERIELYKQITKGEIGDSINHLPSNWFIVVKQCLIVDCDKRIEDASGCIELLSGVSIEVKPNTLIVETNDVPKQRKKNRRFKLMSPLKAIGSFVRKWKIAIIAVLVITMIPIGLYYHWDYKYHYDEARSFYDGLAAVKKGDKWGFIDAKGNLIISYMFPDIGSSGGFKDGLFCVYSENKWIFINKSGKNAFPNCKYQFDENSVFNNGFVLVDFGYIDIKGDFKESNLMESKPFYKRDLSFPVKKEYVEKRIDQLAHYEYYYPNNLTDEGSHWWPAIPWYPNYTKKRYVKETYKYVELPCYWDSSKRVIIYKGDGLGFTEGLAAVTFDNKWYYINTKGKIVIPFGYENARSFSEGLAAVCIGNKWGFIDINGNEIIQLKYENAFHFKNGCALVKENGRLHFINKKGEYLGWW